jgi:hypothetical protein
MSEDLISPAAMIDLLQSPYSAHIPAGRDRADFEIWRDLYRARSDDPLVRHIQSSLNHTIDGWDDEQVKDFWMNYLLEPPQSDEYQDVSAQERRVRLRRNYDNLFDTL